MLSGTGTLEGLNGDDVLYAGAAGTALTGGGGANTFVLQAANAAIWPQGFDWAEHHYNPDGTTQPPWSSDGSGDTSWDLPDLPGPAQDAPEESRAPQMPSDAITYTGTDEAETVKGAQNVDDVMVLAGGADNLWERGGNNYAKGGAGDDTLSTNGGNDTILGGLQNDSIAAYEGDEVLLGEDGRDTVWGGLGMIMSPAGRART